MTRSATPAKVAEAGPVMAITLTNGHFPRRRGLVILLSSIAGFLLTVVWSAWSVRECRSSPPRPTRRANCPHAASSRWSCSA